MGTVYVWLIAYMFVPGTYRLGLELELIMQCEPLDGLQGSLLLGSLHCRLPVAVRICMDNYSELQSACPGVRWLSG